MFKAPPVHSTHCRACYSRAVFRHHVTDRRAIAPPACAAVKDKATTEAPARTEGPQENGVGTQEQRQDTSPSPPPPPGQQKPKVKREKLFGPSSRLTNERATRKRKAPVQQQGRTAPSSSAGSGRTNGRVVEKKGSDSTSLEDLNPYTMGRRSRVLLDGIWQKFTSLSAPGRVSMTSEELDRVSSLSGDSAEFQTPQAAVTCILVLGASGRVGRILVRKLLLRGYPVTVLVRPDSPGKEKFPESIKVIEGDVGDYSTVRKAIEGVDKVIYCADPRTTLTGDVKRVCVDGVLTAAKALQDERNCGISQPRWPLNHGIQPHPTAKKRIAGGRQSDGRLSRKLRWIHWKILHAGAPGQAAEQQDRRSSRKLAPVVLDTAQLRVNKRKNLVFYGSLYARSAYASTGIDMNLWSEGMANTVGLVVRVKGDGQTYSLVLTTDSGASYMARFNTTTHFQNIRLPFNAFRRMEGPPGGEGPQVLDPAAVRKLAVRFDNRGRPPKKVTSNDLAGLSDRGDRDFSLEINRINALPDGTETDFVLLSCAGTRADAVDPLEQEKLLNFKRQGEAALRTCGLGYTIVRPGPIIEEPGSYKALVFDQGNRIRQSISRADVADVCLKSLHDSAARNKTFEVCHEYTPASGLEMYELVAHLPDKANSYLTPALANLERET